MASVETPVQNAGQNIEAIHGLSPLQEGLLFHALLAPGSTVYFEQVSCRLKSLRHPEYFRKAWQLALDRHASLRAGFYWKNRKRPLQIVRKSCEVPWAEHDWRDRPPAERGALLEGVRETDRNVGFDLSTAPLMRCTLVRVGEAEYQFVWSHHHLILDGWSASLIVDEVFATYEALCDGHAVRLPPSRPYREYINWLDKRESGHDEGFWKSNLRGFTAATPICATFATNALSEQDAEYAERDIRVSEEVTAALQQLAQQQRLTLSCIVQAAWGLLLSRTSGEREVLFGSTVSGRPPELPGVERMVGVFINALPVRIDVAPGRSVVSWLQQLMAEQIEREQHAGASLVDIQRWSDVPAGKPLFESLVIFENYPLRESENALGIDDLRLFRRTNYPLTLVAAPESALHLAISYDTSRFDAISIESMLARLRLLLEQIAARPLARLLALSLVSDEDLRSIVRWNDTTARYQEGVGIHRVFASRVRDIPDALALVFGGASLTYAGLNARANQMARYLRERGVGPETLVGICVERSIDMIVAILGVLKAGGAYLPLDPSYPEERLAFMIEDAAVPVLITQEHLEGRIPAPWAQFILIDAEWTEIGAQPGHDLHSSVAPENVAYVIYTSGSTGKPKGVAVTHRGLCNLAAAQEQLFAPLVGGHVLQFASLSFDASIWEIVMALCSGAALHLGDSESLMPGPALARALDRGAITHVTLPPMALGMLPKVALPCLHTLVVAGEACPPDLRRIWSSGRRVVNAYGPTESTVCATAWACGDDDTVPPIGRPLDNTRAWPADSYLNPLPIGVAGQLHVGGANLARGYLRRPALSAERFVPDPLSGIPGARLYNTGDLARYRADGALMFLGRADHQIKVRGHRVEPGEIEAALTQLPGVREAVVIARADASGGNVLAAYVAGSDVDAATLRDGLRERLPEYMIPGLFVTLDALPLTPNGKVDRQALPAADEAASQSSRAFRSPRDLAEQQLVAIWEDVLNVHPVGVDDDFFLLGGHSLLAVRLMAAIEQQFDRHLPMATLFSSPTVARLATGLRRGSEAQAWSSLVAVQSAGSGKPVFFIPGGGGNVVYLYALAHRIGMDRPLYGLQARGLDGRSDPHSSIEEMASAYIDEIRKVQPVGPYLLAGHSSGSWVAFDMARQLQEHGHEVELVVLIDTPAPISETKTADVDDDEALYLTKVSRLIERWAGKDLGISYDALKLLSSAEQMDYLGARLQTVDIVPPEAGQDQVRGLIQVFKASTRNCTRYLPQGLYQGAVTLLRANEIHIEDTGIRINLRADDDSWGWNQLVDGPVDISIVPGDHVTMMAEPHVRALAAELVAAIHKAESPARTQIAVAS